MVPRLGEEGPSKNWEEFKVIFQNELVGSLPVKSARPCSSRGYSRQVAPHKLVSIVLTIRLSIKFWALAEGLIWRTVVFFVLLFP